MSRTTMPKAELLEAIERDPLTSVEDKAWFRAVFTSGPRAVQPASQRVPVASRQPVQATAS